jgi:hypothetical protein
VAFGHPSRCQRTRTRPVMTTCIHAQWRTSGTLVPVQRPRGPGSGVQTDVTIGQASGHPMPGRIWADTFTSIRHAIAAPEGTRTGDGRPARQHSDILDNHNQEDGPPDAGPSCGAGACGWTTNDRSATATLPPRP